VITFCNTTQTLLVVDYYSVTPDNVQPHETLTIKVTATLKETITSGKITVVAKVDNFPIYSTTLNFCDAISEEGYSCPLSAQKLTITQLVNIGDIPFSGTLTANAQIYDQNNVVIACVDLSVNV